MNWILLGDVLIAVASSAITYYVIHRGWVGVAKDVSNIPSDVNNIANGVKAL